MDNENKESTQENLSGTNDEGQHQEHIESEQGHQQEDNQSSDDLSELKTRLASLEKRNRELNHENAKHRNRAKENEKDATEAKKTALEAIKQIEGLKKNIEQQAVKSKLLEEAAKSGVNDFSTFEKLIDKTSLKISDSGDVSGLHEQIQSLKDNKSLASLFETSKPKSTSHGFIQPLPNTTTNNDVSKLDRADYKKAKAELLRNFSRR